MADPIADIHMVITTCGVDVDATRTLIINNGYLTSIADFGFLDGGNDDITKMSSRMARREANNDRVILGGIQIKKIQALVWWVRDRQKLGQPIDSALLTAAAMTNAVISKRIKKYQPKADMKAAYLKAFNPDDFKTHEVEFMNLFSQTTSVTKKCTLLYIVRLEVDPDTFTDEFEERMFQMLLIGKEYNLDHCTLYAKLKAFLSESAGYAWIERYDHAANRGAAFQVWVDHYNGVGELNKRTALAKARMKELHYKNEQSMLFEKYTEIIIKCFSTLYKDEDWKLSDQKKSMPSLMA